MNQVQTPQHTAVFNYRPLTPDELTFYNENGYLVIRSILTEQGVQQMRQEAMAAWHAEKEGFDLNRSWLQNSLLVNIHHKSPTIRDYYFEGPLVDVAEQIIGPNLKGATSQLTFKMRGNTKPFGWHQDNGYGELEPYTAITALTALDDTDRGNGCLWLIPGSHKDGQIRVERSEEERKKSAELIVEADDSLAIPMEMRAGDCLIFSCWTLHKSDGNFSTDRDRRILFLRYADADAVEVYNKRKPRLGRLMRGTTTFDAVREFEQNV